ncbi:septum formation family protein [Actinomadura sp. NAK00032]|uniref:DUF4190 domain-containing protein n=1 Tax=Actinomadura sp. NAK00032 TaxID=2742128 RepID=UPI0015903B6C|nr:DUF4190 domain-containing protein [Actinomadura sp. NAK00032]QKW34968.1 septum formation family protein [Actinomadura sp. NAK00032]
MTTPPSADDLPDDPTPAWASPDVPAPTDAPVSPGPPASQAPPPGALPPALAPGPGPARTNRLAVTALVTGVLALVPLAIGFGIAALVQAGRRGEKGKGLAAGGLAASAVWIVVAALAAATAVGSVLTVDRDASGHVTGKDRVLPSFLHVGDCFAGFTGDVQAFVTALPCTQPHNGEAAARLNLTGTGYPGDQEVLRQADEACGLRLAGLQKSRYAEHLQSYVVLPNRTTWRAGDREVLCLMHYEGTGKITTPLAATLDPGLKLWHELDRGDCLGKWKHKSLVQRVLPCTGEHWIEVVAVFELKGGAYPGTKGTDRKAEAGCDKRFAKVFRRHPEPDLVSWMMPQKGEWETGIRTAVCMGESEDRPLKKPLLP